MSNVDRLIMAMEQYADQEGLLSRYREDLTIHDRRTLECLSGWPTFCWMVGESFTHIYPLNFHHQTQRHALVALDARESRHLVCVNAATERLTTMSEKSWRRAIATPAGIAEDADGYLSASPSVGLGGQPDCGRLLMSYSFRPAMGAYEGFYEYRRPQSALGFTLPDGWVAQYALAKAASESDLWTTVTPIDQTLDEAV